MKKISVWILILVFAVSLASAQETATQQQIDKLSGQIQDLLDAQAQQGKRLDALEREISDLRDKINNPVVTDYATHAELRALAEQAQEIDRKRKEDTENTANQLAALARATAAAPPAPIHTHSSPKIDHPDDTPASATPDQGYYYEVKQGDNLGLIIKAYHQKGVKVTKSQIIAANPKMNPDVLIPGKKIFIPDASAK
jgi:TolA-binding protein